VIACYARARLPEMAEEWLDKMEEADILPNVISFSSAISAYSKTGQHEEAVRLLKKMVSVGVQPDTVTLNAVIDSHARAGLVQQAMGWLNRTIRGEFEGVSADVVSYTILISALSRRGRLAAASRLLERMGEAGVQADVMCYNTLISGAASGQRWELVDTLLGRMKSEGVVPDQWTYGPLLEACRRMGDRKRSRRIGREMLLSGSEPSAFCMTSLRRALGLSQLKALCNECGVKWVPLGREGGGDGRGRGGRRPARS